MSQATQSSSQISSSSSSLLKKRDREDFEIPSGTPSLIPGESMYSCFNFKDMVNPINESPDYKDNLNIEFELVTNDESNEACVKLIALKNIFSKQLPKMPKEYIVRLVFDKRHVSLAIKRKQRVIGGICYRQYKDQRFGEIAFCAVNSNEQVKGYGTKLMNALKYVAQQTGMEYFLTYADNFAIGYFQKQGFSKHISMPKERWVGFIKDYDGGTLMECYIHPGMDYLNVSSVVAKQRRFILDRAAESSLNHIVYEGLTCFDNNRRIANILDIPGVVDAGWTSLAIYKSSTERDRNVNQTKLNQSLKTLMEKVRSHKACKQLLSLNYPNFRDEDPKRIDWLTVNSLLKQGDYYRSKEALSAELDRMIEYYKKFFEGQADALEVIANFAAVIADVFDQKDKSTAVASSNDVNVGTATV